MEEKEKIMFLDAETDGLYGPFISIAAKVLDKKSGTIEDSLYIGIAKDVLQVADEWTKENVLPYLGDYKEFKAQEELLEYFWAFYVQKREETEIVGDTIFPVEDRLFASCVQMDVKNRMFLAPYPLLDLSSMLYAKGIDPMIEREKLVDHCIEGTKHNAMYDIELSIEIWKKYMWGKDE